MSEPTVPCGICGVPTTMTGTKRCDRCWELEGRIAHAPQLARKILYGNHPQPTHDLRAHLAGQAIAGLLANAELLRAMSAAAECDTSITMGGIALMAVNAADCLIAELNK